MSIKEKIFYKNPVFWLMAAAIGISAITTIFSHVIPAHASTIPDQLDSIISSSILAENRELNQSDSDYFACEDHVILGVKKRHHQITVYMMSLYEEYAMVNGTIQEEAGGHYPIALTYIENDDNTFTLKEYWVPADGSDWESSVKKKFPRAIWSDAMNTQKYIKEQSRHCLKQAKQYYGV